MNTYDSASKSSKTDLELRRLEHQDAMMYQSFNNHAPTKITTINASDIRIQENLHQEDVQIR